MVAAVVVGNVATFFLYALFMARDPEDRDVLLTIFGFFMIVLGGFFVFYPEWRPFPMEWLPTWNDFLDKLPE